VECGQELKMKKTAIFPDLIDITKKLPGANYISYPTGLAAYIFSKVVSKIKNPGVIPPEVLDYSLRKQILVELESYGIIIDYQYTKKKSVVCL